MNVCKKNIVFLQNWKKKDNFENKICKLLIHNREKNKNNKNINFYIMKKVVSFCIFSVLMVMISLGLKAQTPSGLTLSPANLNPIQANQYDTVYLIPGDCFDLLGLADDEKVSIEWEILKDGTPIPNGQLSRYFNEFKFESYYRFAQFQTGNQRLWWGKTYVSDYCDNGNGIGSYPGAKTSLIDTMDMFCRETGHFAISLPGQNNPYEFDYFYAKFFKDTVNTAHRLVYNVKEDGDYQFVFHIYRRCNGTKWDQIYVNNNERYYVGGHQSELCGLLSSDTLKPVGPTVPLEVSICNGTTYTVNGVVFDHDTTGALVNFYGVNSCGASIDSIVDLTLHVIDPAVPTLDTLNSTLQVCDEGDVTLVGVPQNVGPNGVCIWYDALGTVIDTANTITQHITANAEFYAFTFNPEGECRSLDSLRVFAEVFTSPNPVVSADTTEQCEGGSFTVALDQSYDKFTWFHGTSAVDSLTTVSFTIDPATPAAAGDYSATVVDTNYHSVYNTMVACSANSDTVTLVVYDHASVNITEFDGVAITTADAGTFCMTEVDHTVTATITGGTAPYTLNWTNTNPYVAHNVSGNVATAHFTTTVTCDTVTYTDGIVAGNDAHNCSINLGSLVSVNYTLEDTDVPHIYMNATSATAEPSLAGNCSYLIPDVTTLVDSVVDACGTVTYNQSIAANTQIFADTTLWVVAADNCGHKDSVEVSITIPTVEVSATDSVFQHVICSGDANGIVDVMVANGVRPYTVTITLVSTSTSYTQTGGYTADTTFRFTGLIKGEWAVNIVDANGCTAQADTLNVSAPNMLELSTSNATNLTCWKNNSGSFEYTINGGSMPYEVKIEGPVPSTDVLNDNVAHSVTALAAGDYTISVIDNHGCKDTAYVTLTEPDSLQITAISVVNNVRCYGESNGNITATVAGGTTDYVYTWISAANDTVRTQTTNATTDATDRILAAGTYTLHVTDANNCPCVDRTETITQHDTLEVVSIVTPNAVECPYQGQYDVTATVAGGTTNHTFNWNVNGTDYPIASNALASDTYTYTEVAPVVCDTTFDITFTVTDDSNCVASMDASQFRIVDNVNPVITGTIADTIVDGCDRLATTVPATVSTVADLYALGIDTITDNCTTVATDFVVTFSDDTTDVACVAKVKATINRTYRVTDKCGNYAETSYMITIQDTVVPTFTRPADITLYKDSTCSVDITVAVTGDVTDENDNCSTGLNATFVDADVTPADACANEQVIERTWSLVDDCGNAAADQVQTIAIKDTIRPWFTVMPKDTISYCDDDNYADIRLAFEQYPVYADNCGVPTYTVTLDSIDTLCNNKTTIEYYSFVLEDACGLTTTAYAKIYTKDTVAPVLSQPWADVTLFDCAASATSYDAWKNGIRIMDHCNDTCWLVDYDSTRTPGCELVFKEEGTWTFTDGCNVSSANSTFDIQDLVSPYFVVEPQVNVTVECDGHGNLDTLRNWYRRVQVADDCDPNVTLNIYYEDELGVRHAWDTTSVDAQGHLPGFTGTSCNGFYKIVWEAIDCSGNGSFTDDNPTTTVEFFRITDSRGPVFEAPAADTVDCANWEADLADWLVVAPAGDSCAQTTYTVSNNSATQGFYSGCYNAGRNVFGTKYVTFTATDGACGNTTSHTSSFTVVDTTAPVTTFVNGTGLADWNINYDPANCTVNAVFPSTVTWTIDTVGHSSDTLARFIAAHRELGITNISDCSFPLGILTIKRVATPTVVSSTPCAKTYRITYIIKDHCGNADTLYQNLILSDTTKPTGNNFSTGIVYVDNACSVTVPTYTTVAELNAHGANIADCPSVDSLTVSVPSVTSSGSLAHCDSTVYKKYTITDRCGNYIYVTDTIRIKDTIKPVISANMPSDIVYSKADCSGVATDTAARYLALLDTANYASHSWTMTISDCSSFTIARTSQTMTPGVCPEKTYYTTYTVTDGCGNTNTFVDTLVITDTVKPVVASYVHTESIDLAENCTFTVPSDILNIATYKDLYNYDHGYTVTECRLDSTALITAADDATLAGDTTADACVRYVHYYYKVKDLCGNISDGKFTITVKITDNTKPVVAGTLVNDTTYMTYPSCEATNVTALRWTSKADAEAKGYTFTDCHLDPSTFTFVRTTGPEDHDCYAVDTNFYTIADSCGNTSAEFRQVIVLLDTTSPHIVTNVVAPDTINMDETIGDCVGAVVDTFHTVGDVKAFDASFTVQDCNVDNTSAVTLISADTAAVSCYRNVVRTYSVTDNCGNESFEVFTQNIVIKDVTAPVLNFTELPVDTAYMLGYAAGCGLNADAVYTTITDVLADNATFTATDCNLVDAITCVADTVLVAGTEAPVVAKINRTYTVTDSCGHNTTFTHLIRIFDTISPVIEFDSIDARTNLPMVNDSVLYAQVGNCEPAVPAAFATVAEVLAYPAQGITAINDCKLTNEVTLDSTYTSVLGCPDTLIRFYHVTDSTGNTTDFVQYVYTMDTTRPATTGTLVDLNVYTDDTCGYGYDFANLAVYTDTTALRVAGLTVKDCHAVTVTYEDGDYTAVDNCPIVGTITRTYTLTDSCGNSTTATQTINVKDTIAPTLDADMIDSIMAYSAGNCTFQIPDFTDTIANHIVDECSAAGAGIVSQTPAAGTVITDTTIVKVVFDDHCGNKDSVNVVVTVPSALAIDTIYADSVSCHSMLDGVVYIAVNGGTANYVDSLYLGASLIVANAGIATDSLHSFSSLAAGDYTVVVTDADGCQTNQSISIKQPDTLVVTIDLTNAAICDNDTTKLHTQILAGSEGTPNYTYTWNVIDLSTNDTTLFDETAAPVDLTDTYSPDIYDLEAGTYKYVVTVVDQRGCSDTASTILTVYPTYEFHDTARVCYANDFVWAGHRTVLASELTTRDTIYAIYDSLHSVNGCDSIWVLHLTVTDNAFLTVRPVGNYSQSVPSDLVDGDIYGTVQTGNYSAGQKGYEIFVDRNCMNCTNVKVGLKYTLYRVEGNDTIELTQDVDDYFTPTYRTYMDQYSMNAQVITTGPVSVPSQYPTIGMGTSAGNHLNYYHLCWLTPEYDCYGTSFSTFQTNSGIGYLYGRANTIGFTQFRLPGNYIIKCELYQFANGNDWYGEGYCHNDSKVGGDIATPVRVLSTINIHLTVTGDPISTSTPFVDPMEGVVTASEVGAIPQAQVYPNPARDFVTVELSGFEGPTTVMLTNANGGVVETINVNIESNSTPIIRVNTSDYAQGVYMITARNNDVIVTKRVVIIR